MRTTKALTALALLLVLAGCDYTQREEVKTERAEKLYQEAIAKYKVGDLAGAEAGFRAAVKDNPGNASARFQLAVLMQDVSKDYLGAMAGYHDFELLAPSSEKVAMARERAAKCELLLARQLAEKYGFAKVDDLKKDLEEVDAALAKAQEELVEMKAENQRLSKDLDRYRSTRAPAASRPAASAPVAEPVARPVSSTPAATARPRTEETVRPAPVVARPKDEATDNEKGLRAAQALLADAADEKPAETKAPAAPQMPARRYRVKEGDTLFGIARTAYGLSETADIIECVRRIKAANARSVTEHLKPGNELILPAQL